MPENYIELPDTKKLVVFETDQHPDFPGTSINIQETLNADIPTYNIVADSIVTGANKNFLSIFNNLPTKRIRVQQVYFYPRILSNITITVQVGYINSTPTGGNDAVINRHAADFPPPTADFIAKTEATGPTPVAGIIFGGNTVNMNSPGKYIVFESSRNMSSLQLRPTLDGIVLRQTSGTGTTAALTAHMVVTLD